MQAIKILSKFPGIGESVFARMSALALKNKAINLAQGFPDFMPPEELIEYLYYASADGFNQYAPMQGFIQLREQIALRLKREYGYIADIDKNLVVTAGATQALFTIFNAFVKYGDQVLIVEPAYDSYGPAVISCGGIPHYIRMKEPDFKFPLEEFLHKLKTGNFKIAIVNNPHNPCGTVLTQEEMKVIAEATEKLNVILIWDEVYDYLVYDEKKHYSALMFESLIDRSIVVFSMGKTLHNTGWKVGYTVAPEYLTNEIKKVHQFNVFSVNTPAQVSISWFMEKNPDFFLNLGSFYNEKRDFFCKNMEETVFKIIKPEGSYFALADFGDWLKKSDEEVAVRLIEEFGVAAIPISAFYHDQYDPGFIRFCFAKKKATLEQAIIKLKDVK